MPITSVSTTYTFDSAYELSQQALQKRYLSALDTAVSDGDVSAAKRALGSIVSSSGEYVPTTTTEEVPADEESSAINEQFTALAQALDDNDAAAAQEIWEQLKADEEAIAAAVSNRAAETDAAEARYALQMATESELYGALFDSTQQTLNSLDSLISGTQFGADDTRDDIFGQWMTGSTQTSSSWEDAMNSWITYNATGSTNQGDDSIGQLLNFSA